MLAHAVKFPIWIARLDKFASVRIAKLSNVV